MVAEFESISAKMAEPGADIDALSSKMDRMQVRVCVCASCTRCFLVPSTFFLSVVPQAQIDAINGWEIERTLEQAMDSLRCPPPDALVNNLSGGEAAATDRGRPKSSNVRKISALPRLSRRRAPPRRAVPPFAVCSRYFAARRAHQPPRCRVGCLAGEVRELFLLASGINSSVPLHPGSSPTSEAPLSL